MQEWFDGNVLTLEMQRCVQNFLAVCQARPEQDAEGDANTQDVYEDEDYEVQAQTLQRALATHVRTSGGDGEEQHADADGEAGAEGGIYGK